MTRWIVLAVAGCCTVLAFFLPWAHLGAADLTLTRFPAWYVYVVAAVVMHGCAGLGRRVAGGVAAAVSGLMVVLLYLRYEDAPSLHGSLVVPAIAPRPGLAAVFGLAGILLTAVVLAAPLVRGAAVPSVSRRTA